VVCVAEDGSGNTGLDLKSAAGCIGCVCVIKEWNGLMEVVPEDWIGNVGTGMTNGISVSIGLKPPKAVWGSLQKVFVTICLSPLIWKKISQLYLAIWILELLKFSADPPEGNLRERANSPETIFFWSEAHLNFFFNLKIGCFIKKIWHQLKSIKSLK